MLKTFDSKFVRLFSFIAQFNTFFWKKKPHFVVTFLKSNHKVIKSNELHYFDKVI